MSPDTPDNMTPRAKRTNSCPSCGTELAYGEKACPECGKKFTKSRKKPKGGRKKPTRSGRIECPSCGALVSNRSKRCPSCKADLALAADKAKTQPVEKADTEPKTETVEQEPLVAEEESQKVEAVSPTDSRFIQEPSETVVVTEGEDTVRCPVCEVVVPKGFRNCPVCNAPFIDTATQAKASAPSAELPEVTRPEDSAAPVVKVAEQEAKATRTRKLKSAKVTTIPIPTRTGVPGRTNGVGQVNGLGKVNGRGIVNGTGIVNGNGLAKASGATNGVGRRPSVSAARRTSIIVRWQFLAVLLAIAIIIPTFVFISYSDKGDKFSVDGDYGDWDGATTYGTRIQSTAPSSNITEWAVGTQSSDLFLYFRTETHMMSSADPESYYLFVDSDDSDNTGYIVESIGADYMLQLTGWESSVQSTSLLQYSSLSDQYDWNAWSATSSLSHSHDGERLEASAHMPERIGESSKFVLVSKDAANRGSVSYTAPLKGGVLVVRQAPSDDVAATGIVLKSDAVALLTLNFTCEGEGGKVTEINPVLVGASLASQQPAFVLKKGGIREITVEVDTSAAADGQLISAEVLASSIVSTFAGVQVIGSGASAYAKAPPSTITIDGAFADWFGRLSMDQDPIPVSNPDVDIDEIGNLSTSLDSYFYVSVAGEVCSGTFVPAMVAKPSGSGGGATIPTRHTAEDTLRIYVDSDKSDSTGQVVTFDSKKIGADRKIEVKGLFGKITSTKEFNYTSGAWAESSESVKAAKDEKRIEISVSAASLGGSADIDFIVEATSWEGRKDLAMFDPSSVKALTRTWIVDPATTSESATSLSCQRKIFFDGMNYWSFYFDGADTVYKYSSDGGITWSSPMRAFATKGVNKVSVWYDPAGGIVYAVGDIGASTRAVTIQRGVVDPVMRTIAWPPIDAILAVSLNDQGDKNTFISKDASGYLWILSSNYTGAIPVRQDLSAFRSSAIDSVTSWVHTGNLVGAGSNLPNCKGSILPAGKDSEMYAIYTYGGNVASRKFTTSWSAENIIYAVGVGNQGNTDNAPPSAVVDSKGVVHVVYGTARKSGTNSAPTIEYSHNETDLTTFTMGIDLDPSMPSKAGDYYPTISLDTSTGSLYALWLRSDDTFAPRTVMARMCVSGIWSEMTIQEQTSYTKQHLTSAYYVSGESKLCWQWTQNTTAPIQVLFDSFLIPEFSNLTPLVFVAIVMFATYRTASRKKDVE